MTSEEQLAASLWDRQRNSMMYKRSSDGKRIVRQPANLSSERARIFASLTSLASPYSKWQFRNSTRQWSPFSASNVSCPAGSSTAARAVKRIFTDMSRKIRLIRNKGCSDRYLDMSKLASSDEIMARTSCENGISRKPWFGLQTWIETVAAWARWKQAGGASPPQVEDISARSVWEQHSSENSLGLHGQE